MPQSKQSDRTTSSTPTDGTRFTLQRARPLASLAASNVRTDYSVKESRFHGEGWYGDIPVPGSSSKDSMKSGTYAHTKQVNSNFQASGWRTVLAPNGACVFVIPDSTLEPPESGISIFDDFDEDQDVLTVEGQRMQIEFKKKKEKVDDDDKTSPSEPTLVYDREEERQTVDWTRIELKAPQNP